VELVEVGVVQLSMIQEVLLLKVMEELVVAQIPLELVLQ
jgi:hypothetical protein